MIKKVNNITIVIAITLFILNRTRKSTTGLSIIAVIVAKTRGTMMLLPMYRIVNKAIVPTRKIAALA